MAITILSQPTKILPAYNRLNYVVSSDKTAQANFRFVCDVYLSGVTSPSYVRLKADTDPSTGYGYFDVHKVIEQYVSYNLFTSGAAGFYQAYNNTRQYTVKFGEEYGSNTSGTTVYAALTSTTDYGWNASMDYINRISFGDSGVQYQLGTSANSFMTYAPSTQYVQTSSNRWLYMLAAYFSGGIGHTMHIDVDDGSTLTPFEILNDHRKVPVDDYRCFAFPCGISNLKQIATSKFTTGSAATLSTALDAAIAAGGRYSMYMKDSATDSSSETKTFDLSKYACTSKYTPITLHWLNRLGGIDTFDFSLLSKRTITNEKKEYKKRTGVYGTSITYAYSDVSRTVYDSKYNESYQLMSDWITDDEAVWLEELVTSPLVWHELAAIAPIPVKIKEGTYSARQRVEKKLHNVEFSFEYMHDNYTQRF
jgi:hypothetical protein